MAQRFEDDMLLVQLYLTGDPKTEKRLYKELNKLISNLFKFVESKGYRFSDKENAIAELIFQIMVADDKKVLRAYTGQSSLSNYLWPITHNKLVDAFRKEMRYYARVDHQDLPEESYTDQNTAPSPNELIIEEHLANVPPLERFIKLAKWFEGQSYDEIITQVQQKFSDQGNINPQRIAYVLHTNRKTLQKKLKNP